MDFRPPLLLLVVSYLDDLNRLVTDEDDADLLIESMNTETR